jgi:hypothetical protein
MSIDLSKNGYMPGYEVWVHHGEDPPPCIVSEVQSHEEGDYDRMKEMFDDVRRELLPIDSENPLCTYMRVCYVYICPYVLK